MVKLYIMSDSLSLSKILDSSPRVGNELIGLLFCGYYIVIFFVIPVTHEVRRSLPLDT